MTANDIDITVACVELGILVAAAIVANIIMAAWGIARDRRHTAWEKKHEQAHAEMAKAGRPPYRHGHPSGEWWAAPRKSIFADQPQLAGPVDPKDLDPDWPQDVADYDEEDDKR
jgi:hypothetical protein